MGRVKDYFWEEITKESYAEELRKNPAPKNPAPDKSKKEQKNG